MIQRLGLLLIVLIVTAAAMPPRGNGGANSCPSSVDGAQIIPPQDIGCVLTDHLGNTYWYDGTMGYGQYALNQNTLGHNIAWSTGFQLNQGRQPYFREWQAISSNVNYIPTWLWTNYETKRQAVAPAQGDLPNWGKNVRTGISYQTLGWAIGYAVSGDTLEALSMPPNLPIYKESYAITTDGLTVNCDKPVATGYLSSPSPLPGQGNWAINGHDFTMNNCEIVGSEGGVNDPNQRGINLNGGFYNLTLNGTYIHDNDFGLLGPGNHRTITLVNTKWDHNGFFNQGPPHNIYLGGDVNDLTHPTTVIANGGYSVCTAGGGFQVKLRGEYGTFQNFTAANPSQNNLDNMGLYHPWPCLSSGAIDMPCGGVYTWGGIGVGQGVVIQAGPSMDGHTGLIRFGEELLGTVTNCNNPESVAPYPVNSLTVQNAWLILDYPGNIAVIYNGAPTNTTLPVTVKNSKIVCNNSIPICDATHVLAAGPGAANVTDGGGNIFFANRAAAGLAPYPALPTPP